MTQVSGADASAITIRPMRRDEKSEVRRQFRQSFPLIQRFFFSWTPDVLVAEHDGKLIGAVVLKTYPLVAGQRGGVITWIFTAPEARGLGAGQRLVEAALDHFQSLGCQEVTACVEGYNVSSSKLFSSRGFSLLSPGEQLKRYGVRILPVWFHIFHFLDIGHFLWANPPAKQADNPFLQWWEALIVNTLITLLVLLRGGNLVPQSFVLTPLLYVLLLGARWLAMERTAAALGLEVRFRAWETGHLVSLAVALLLGGLFPIPGGAYPLSNQWSYRTLKPKLGRMALAGVLPTLVVAALSSYLLQSYDGPES